MDFNQCSLPYRNKVDFKKIKECITKVSILIVLSSVLSNISMPFTLET